MLYYCEEPLVKVNFLLLKISWFKRQWPIIFTIFVLIQICQPPESSMLFVYSCHLLKFIELLNQTQASSFAAKEALLNLHFILSGDAHCWHFHNNLLARSAFRSAIMLAYFIAISHFLHQLAIQHFHFA